MSLGGIYVFKRESFSLGGFMFLEVIYVFRRDVLWRYLCSSEAFMYFGRNKEGVGSLN